jgi:uncharacterized protein (UPF0335 family)
MNSHQLITKRSRLGLTQRQVAELFGVDQSTVGRWELGTRKIPRFVAQHFETITGIARDASKLLSLVERIERLDGEIDDLKRDRADVVKEAKSAGYNTKLIAEVLRLKRARNKGRQLDLFEEERAFYMQVLGLLPNFEKDGEPDLPAALDRRGVAA